MLIVEQSILGGLFLVALIVNVIAEVRESDLMRAYSKPLLMPLLIVYYLIMSRDADPLIVLALLCAFNGDVALLFQEKRKWFTAGAILFMFGHFFFIAAFVRSVAIFDLDIQSYLWPAIPALLPSILAFIALYKYMGDFKTHAFFYMLAASGLLYSVLLRVNCCSGLSLWLPIVGTAFFFLSDFFIARTRFQKDFRYSGILTIVTYAIAEVALVIGFNIP